MFAGNFLDHFAPLVNRRGCSGKIYENYIFIFQLFLQWIAEEQLTRAARKRGDGLGLYLDLAVGVNSHGAEVWEDKELFATKASSGAPPDLLNVLGQVWGLAPYIP